MNFLRRHWYDLGFALAVILSLLLVLFYPSLPRYQLLMWINLVSLFLHQTEEYRFPGTFPGMVNKVMFQSDAPDRYPLNSNTALIINVAIGWSLYILAALTGAHCVWLGMASILVSLGNVIAHTFVFNIKGKTIYNAGLATSWLLFLPCIFFFFKIIRADGLASTQDYFIGIPLGICINVLGVLKPIGWLADAATPFSFQERQLLKEGNAKK